MKRRSVLLAAGCVLALAFSSCRKGDEVQGPPDYGDPNYLVCRVDGMLRKTLGLDNWNRGTGASYDRFANEISFGGDNETVKDDVGIYLYVPPDSIKPNITYQFGGAIDASRAAYMLFKTSDGSPVWEYHTRPGSGWVRFSKVDKAIIVGTFAFTAYRNSQPDADSVVVTDGVFSIAAK